MPYLQLSSGTPPQHGPSVGQLQGGEWSGLMDSATLGIGQGHFIGIGTFHCSWHNRNTSLLESLEAGEEGPVEYLWRRINSTCMERDRLCYCLKQK